MWTLNYRSPLLSSQFLPALKWLLKSSLTVYREIILQRRAKLPCHPVSDFVILTQERLKILWRTRLFSFNSFEICGIWSYQTDRRIMMTRIIPVVKQEMHLMWWCRNKSRGKTMLQNWLKVQTDLIVCIETPEMSFIVNKKEWKPMFSYKWACPTLFFSVSCTSLHNMG